MNLATVEPRYGELKRGLSAGVSIAIGYAPIALTFGLLAKTTDLSFIMTIMMSMIVFAGASQYIALNLIALGTGVFEIILTTFIVNIRHFLMSTALQEKVEDEKTFVKAAYAFGITDETFSVVATKKDQVSTGYVVGVFSIAYASWCVFSGVGYIFGAAIPSTLQEGMSVALYAMFIGLLAPSLRGNRKVVFLAVTAALFNSIFTLNDVLSTGWSIVVSTLLSAFIIEGIVYSKKHMKGW